MLRFIWQKLVIIILFMGFIGIPVPLSLAAETNYYLPSVSNLDGKVEISKTGIAEITQTISFSSITPFQWEVRLKPIEIVKIESDYKQVEKEFVTLSRKGNSTFVKVDNSIQGVVWRLVYQTTDAFHFNQKQEYFRWEVLTEPNIPIQDLKITIHSPIPLSNSMGRSYRVYAYHGVTTSKAELLNKESVSFWGSNLGPKAGFTVVMEWPRGSLDFSWQRRLLMNLTILDVSVWILFGLILPVITLVLLIVMYWKRKRVVLFDPPREMIHKPPSDIPPLLVGILVEKKIYPHTLLSTIFDLCERGYLVIIKENGKYILGKRKKPDETLREWEKDLLEEIFSNSMVWAKQGDVEIRSNKQLFSPKILHIYEKAYESVMILGYFTENPHIVRIRYKIAGIILYLASVLGIVWMALSLQSSYLIIPLGGVLLATLVIVKLAPLMPMQSKKGVKEMVEWIAFRNYLTNKEQLGASESVGGMFYQYLPYAVALNVEKQWVARFRNYRLVLPDWYSSPDEIEAEQVIYEITKMISHLSQSLSQLRGPAVS